jgi:hypothetical protein
MEIPMRLLILIASLVLAGNVLAGDKTESPIKELDKSSPRLVPADDAPGLATAADAKEKANKTKGRAQDYNSSRSNNSSALQDKVDDVDGDGRPDVVTCRAGADDDCDDADKNAAPANHNTTRSNRLAPASDGDDRVVRKKPGKR